MLYTVYYSDVDDIWVANADGIIRWWKGKDKGPEAYQWLAQFIIEDGDDCV